MYVDGLQLILQPPVGIFIYVGDILRSQRISEVPIFITYHSCPRLPFGYFSGGRAAQADKEQDPGCRCRIRDMYREGNG